jgi:hypothetical protein
MIRLVEGLHLTATNRRHMGQILAQGWQRGESGRIAYTLEPLPDCPNRWRFTLAKRGRDDWGRVSIDRQRGIIEAMPPYQ